MNEDLKNTQSASLGSWTVGIPPEGVRVAMACRKWCGIHNERYVEVIAHDPSMYLESLGLEMMMKPSVTVIYGSVFTQGNTTCILNEHGMPVGAYPNSILAWTRVPEDLLQNLQAAVIFRRRLHGISEVSRTTFSDAN